jgi:leader peptidase (prepilin peptidase)/N-methyltransferase
MFLDAVIVTFLGLVLGSFSTALAFRIPREIPWFVSNKKKDGATAYRSHCPSCQTTLGVLDLVPVFSWVFLKGRCRHCRVNIPVEYPATEMASVLVAFSVYNVMGLTLLSVAYFALIPFLIALLVIDLKFYILPNHLVFIVAALGALNIITQVSMGFEDLNYAAYHVFSALIYGGVSWGLGYGMTKVLKRDSLGFGDVKFFAAVGLWLGWDHFPEFLMLSGFLGLVMALIWKKVKGSDIFPFGPALIVSFWMLLLFNSSHFY